MTTFWRLIMTGILLLLFAMWTFAMPPERKEERIDVFIDTAELLHFCYDTNGDGKIDFEVVRRQTIFIVNPDKTITFAEKPFWERYPFIYYYDVNGNGTYEKDEMFLDKESDGINGNEIPLE